MINKAKKKHHSASGKLKGKELQVDIVSLTNTGDGLARHDNQVVFVPYTMPGDTVRIKVLQDKGSFLIASLLEIVAESPDRIIPSCDYFGKCGGCDWLHIPYQLQLDVKVNELRETLSRIGGLPDTEIQEIIASPKSTRYRNRIQGHIQDNAFHFMRRGSNKLIAIRQCEIADARINQRIAQGFKDIARGKVELSVSDEKVLLTPKLAKGGGDGGFRQVNTEMGLVLHDLVLSTLRTGEFESVNDLYCGRGEWTNAIAQLLPNASVVGIDAMPENIALAESYAAREGLQNVNYVQALVEEALSRFEVKNSFCIVDPPRAGLDTAVTKALCRRPARELIYVSCHAASLARDLKILTDGGYEITLIQPLDMFPQTAHLETLVRLRAS